MNKFSGTSNGAKIQELADSFYRDRSELPFGKLYTALETGLNIFAMNLLKEEHLADDAVACTLIKAWTKADMYDPGKSRYTTWIYAVLQNECRQIMLRKRKVSELPLLEAITANLEAPGDYYDETNEEVMHEAAIAAILDLPEPYRQVIIMYDLEHIKYKDIAERLGLKLDTVKTQISRGRALVRKSIGHLRPVPRDC